MEQNSKITNSKEPLKKHTIEIEGTLAFIHTQKQEYKVNNFPIFGSFPPSKIFINATFFIKSLKPSIAALVECVKNKHA
jgi:hypothetical protein